MTGLRHQRERIHERQDRIEDGSIADLHERLGDLLAGPIGLIKGEGSTKPRRNSPSPLRGLTVDVRVDLACSARLAAWSRRQMARLSPERRAELEAEWEGDGESHSIVAQKSNARNAAAMAKPSGQTAARISSARSAKARAGVR